MIHEGDVLAIGREPNVAQSARRFVQDISNRIFQAALAIGSVNHSQIPLGLQSA